jgi:hypothetical protein
MHQESLPHPVAIARAFLIGRGQRLGTADRVHDAQTQLEYPVVNRIEDRPSARRSH